MSEGYDPALERLTTLLNDMHGDMKAAVRWNLLEAPHPRAAGP